MKANNNNNTSAVSQNGNEPKRSGLKCHVQSTSGSYNDEFPRLMDDKPFSSIRVFVSDVCEVAERVSLLDRPFSLFNSDWLSTFWLVFLESSLLDKVLFSCESE